MKNSEVAEIFARNERQAQVRHLFIEDKSIYSYGHHFKVAEKLDDNTALFNSCGYSISTARHKSHILRALKSNGYKVIFIAECDIDNLSKEIRHNESKINELNQKKTRNEITTEYKEQAIKEFKEQNNLLIDLAIKKGIIIEAI